jgi:long-chain acyl-CoA synthetase
MLIEDVLRHASERGTARAIVAHDARWSYAELADRVDAMAAALARRGVTPGQTVALVFPNSSAFVLTLLALGRLGAIALPLGADLSDAEMQAAVDLAGARLVLGREEYTRATVESWSAEATARWQPPMVDPDAPFLRQITSGTSGARRHVVRTHAQVTAAADALQRGAATGPDDRFLGLVPFSHGHGLSNALVAALHVGGTLVVQERFDRRGTLRILAEEAVTVFPAVPFLVSILAETRIRDPIDLSSLRLAFTGGGPLTAAVWRKMHDRFGVDVGQSYGSTETATLTLNPGAVSEGPTLSVGRPLPGVTVAVLDDEGRLCPIEQPGEVVVKSPGAAVEVYGTDGRHRLADGDGWIRLGDLGYLSRDGRLTLTGRRSLTITVAGLKVNPWEVEAVIRAHPRVCDVVVVGIPDRYGEEFVKAVVVADGCTASDIQVHCRQLLPDHKVPRVVEFRAAIRRYPTGKIILSELVGSPPQPQPTR